MDVSDVSREDAEAARVATVEAALKAKKKAERERFRAATDSEYWFAVVFPSRAAKDEFLARHGLGHLGDKYLDGRLVDAVLMDGLAPGPVAGDSVVAR